MFVSEKLIPKFTEVLMIQGAERASDKWKVDRLYYNTY
jgi:hypothetical protein